MKLELATIRRAAASALIEAGTTLRPDQIDAYERALARETKANARWVLERLLENGQIAASRRRPLCDDTGIPHVIVEIGDQVQLPPGWLAAIHAGIAAGLQEMPGRAMAVKGDGQARVEQSQGLYSDPGMLEVGPVITRTVPGTKLTLTVLLLGGGPEIRARTHRVFHRRSLENVLKEAASWLLEEIASLGCTPAVPAIGIGRTHAEAAAMMLLAMATGDLNRQNSWEEKVTHWINQAGVGPLGLGGKTTVLGTLLCIGPARASGIRVVSLRPCCAVEPRRGRVELNGGDE